MQLMDDILYLQEIEKVDCDLLNGKTIAISGATGMIGSCLVDSIMYANKYKNLCCKIFAFGRSCEKAKKRFSYCWYDDMFTFIECDICDVFNVFPSNIDYIVHAASNADPISFSKYPVDTMTTNIMGTNELLKCYIKAGASRFLFVSSGEVYGQPDEKLSEFVEDYCGEINYSESRSCYPSAKRASEVLCQSYIKQYDLDIVIVRPCHLFGPTITNSDSRVLSEFFRNAASKKNIVLKSSGAVERSQCYIIDAINAILYVLSNGKCGEAYNISDKRYQMTIRDFAEKVAKSAKCKVVYEQPSNIEKNGYSKVVRQVLNNSKLTALGWKIILDDYSCIDKTVKVLGNIL